jgi:hypothetical protein
MIRTIRKRHKFVWIVLAVLLPILFIAGIVFRHADPVNESIPRIVKSE